ncbi:DUF6894 family protein [Sphingosinicella rhizophila]|uniref:DUF6894 domain-containing protein n=1 Tax=Sphingosinicella rhizophila TaxID=3050082 RepID=A0ABU3Q5S4_9SPHN|nr:hypothetical protein [Sphingosinicella sp. GR2756]MDT9598652.1 hypothetical protein [Sphingosinicella sp. GR2756]
MPRYFFHIYNDAVIRDTQGEELPDLNTARDEALQAARALICLSVKKGHVNLNHRVEVVNEDGECIAAVPFRHAVTISS